MRVAFFRPRAATVTAQGPLKCVKLDRARSAKALEFVIFILAHPSYE